MHQTIAHYNLPTLKVSNQKYARFFINSTGEVNMSLVSVRTVGRIFTGNFHRVDKYKVPNAKINISALRGPNNILLLILTIDCLS